MCNESFHFGIDLQVPLQYHDILEVNKVTMSLQRALAERPVALTETDERLLKAILGSPTEAAFLSIAELSRRAGVHQASAVRLAKKLGFQGYPDLRASLQQDLLRTSEPADRVRRRLDHMQGDILAALVASEADVLTALPRFVTQAQLDQAARLLIGARRVFLFGRGHATALVDLMDRRLRRSGFATVPLPFEGRDLAEHVLDLKAEDVVLAFALHRTPPGLPALLTHARAVGAASLVLSDLMLSDLVGPLLHPPPTALLAAPRGEEAEFQTLTVPMALCNALVLTIARHDDNRSLEALEHLSDLLERFAHDPRSDA
jgi:DNA-binding MurR/RpiR family transcriptional regulator